MEGMLEKDLMLKLQQAGVSADVILALIMDEGTPAAETPAAETPAGTPDPETPAAQPEQNQTPQTDAVLAAIEKLTGAIQASNIINAGAAGRPQTVTVDDVMAKLIQPQAPGKE